MAVPPVPAINAPRTSGPTAPMPAKLVLAQARTSLVPALSVARPLVLAFATTPLNRATAPNALRDTRMLVTTHAPHALMASGSMRGLMSPTMALPPVPAINALRDTRTPATVPAPLALTTSGSLRAKLSPVIAVPPVPAVYALRDTRTPATVPAPPALITSGSMRGPVSPTMAVPPVPAINAPRTSGPTAPMPAKLVLAQARTSLVPALSVARPLVLAFATTPLNRATAPNALRDTRMLVTTHAPHALMASGSMRGLMSPTMALPPVPAINALRTSRTPATAPVQPVQFDAALTNT